MNLISKEILMSHLQRSEGAEEVSLPIDFFRDLLYQAMPRTWIGLTQEELYEIYDESDDGSSPCGVCGACSKCKIEVSIAQAIQSKLKEKNT